MRKARKRHRLSPRLFELAVNEATQRLQRELIQQSTDILDFLPSIQEFIKRYNVSLGVARKVYERLAAHGFIEKKAKKGAILLQKPSDWQFEEIQQTKSLGFIPSHNLRGKTIGLVTYLDRRHPNFLYNRSLAMYNAMNTFCHQYGAISFQFNPYPKHQIDDRLIREIKKRQPDGLIYLAVSKSEADRELTLLRNLQIPLVVAYHKTPYEDNIIINNEAMAFEATKHLIEQQHRHILFLHFDCDKTWNAERLTGFKRALASHSQDILSNSTVALPYQNIGPDEMETTYRNVLTEKLPEFIKQGVTGIVCSAPVVGKALLDCAVKMKLHIPNDLAFINIGEHFLYDQENMSMVRFPVDTIGRITFETLIKRIQNPSAITQQLRVPGELIQRGTT